MQNNAYRGSKAFLEKSLLYLTHDQDVYVQ